MDVLVIGGTRFIGPCVVRKLVQGGHRVTVFHRGVTETDLPPGVSHIHGNRENIRNFTERFESIKPEVVIDMAPRNERQAETLISALRHTVGRFVAISSQDVYRAFGLVLGIEPGDSEPLPITEDSDLRSIHFPYRNTEQPDDPMYDYEKILVERAYLNRCEIPATVLRLPMVYGPGDAQHRLHPYLKRMDDARPAILISSEMAGWRWARAFVDDVASAIVLSTVRTEAAGKVYNVSQPDTLTERQWIESIAGVTGWRGDIITAAADKLPEHVVTRINATQDLVVSSDRIRQDLGFREGISLEESLGLTVEWERQNPPSAGGPTADDYRVEDAWLSGVRQQG